MLITIFMIIKFSRAQNFCDLDTYCKNCLNCTNCYCNFYNGYCSYKKNEFNISREFLIDNIYCYVNFEEIGNICGESFINISDIKDYTKVINFNSTNIKNFTCYYYFYNEDLNNNFRIRIQKNGIYSPKFNTFFIIYDNYYDLKNETFSNVTVTDTYFEIEETNFSIIAFYLDFESSENIEQLSLIFNNYYNIPTIETFYPEILNTSLLVNLSLTYPILTNDTQPVFLIPTSMEVNVTDVLDPNQKANIISDKSSKGLLIGIIIGGISLVIVIIITVVLLKKRYVNKDRESSNISYITQGPTVSDMENTKKEIDILINQFQSGMFVKNKIKDYNNCTLCQDQFTENQIIIQTKCGHIFHRHCFRNYMYKDFRYSKKCPKCHNIFLSLENINEPKILYIENN